MRTLLSGLLSICILVSSVSPSLAQGSLWRGAARGLSRATGKGIAQQGSRIAGGMVGRLPNGIYVAGGGTQWSLPEIEISVPDITKTLELGFANARTLPAFNVEFYQKLNLGEAIDVKKVIFEAPLTVRPALFRNEFTALSLNQKTSLSEQKQVLDFLRKDLSKAGKSFAKLPEGISLEILLRDATQSEYAYRATVLETRDALSDAAGIALFGAREDAALLVDFYQKASSTVFEPVALHLTGRGLLRLGAYEELKKLALETPKHGEFWNGINAVAKEKGLPVEVAVSAGSSKEMPVIVADFLRSGNVANIFNADASYEATLEWLELGSKPFIVQTPAAAVRGGAQPAALDVSLPEIPQEALRGIDLSISPSVLNTSSSIGLKGAEQGFRPLSGQTVAPVESGTVSAAVPATPVSTNTVTHKKFSWTGAKTWVKDLFVTRVEERPATVINAAGQEEALPLNLKVYNSRNRLGADGYDRVTFEFNPNFKNGYIAQFRNGHEPKEMKHFFFKMESDRVGELMKLYMKSSPTENFVLKLEQRPNVNYRSVRVQVRDWDGNLLPLEVELPSKSLLKGSHVVLMKNGSLGMRVDGTDRVVAFEGHYVRLPKSEISKFITAIKGHKKPFSLEVHRTSFRAGLVIKDASLTNVSLGKVMGPIAKNQLGIPEADATNLMFGINYIMPGFASLLTPVLKKYGEKNLMLVAMGMSTLAGALAAAGGFWGFVEGVTLGPVQKGLFVTALLLMSGSSILKQLVSNMLIRANRAEVVLDNVGKAAKTVQEETAKMEKQGLPLLWQRSKEFFTKASNANLKDVILYNLAFVYKNLGTLAFLSSPYAINWVTKLTTGVDLGLDYSVSFPIFAAYGAGATWKMWRSKLRDAYSAQDLAKTQASLDKALDSSVNALVQEAGKLSHTTIDGAARAIKESMEDLAFAATKLNTDLGKKDVYKKLKGEVLPRLETKLVEAGLPAERAQEITKQVAASIKAQENLIGNMWKMLKTPGVFALTSAMTMATVHEFVLASKFASQMVSLIPTGEFANFLIASTLYLPFIIGRLGGNIISKRISSGSMYIFCSALSALGTGMMLGAGDSVGMTVAGAAVASLGVGNFFTQMYDYIMRRYPKQNRELSSILALTMGLAGFAALPASEMVGNHGLWYAMGMLGGSLALTTPMMRNSSFVKALRYYWTKGKTSFKNIFKRGGNKGSNPGAPGTSGDPAPVQ